MAVMKEFQWLAAAGECGRDAVNHGLLTSGESARLSTRLLRGYIIYVYYILYTSSIESKRMSVACTCVGRPSLILKVSVVTGVS